MQLFEVLEFWARVSVYRLHTTGLLSAFRLLQLWPLASGFRHRRRLFSRNDQQKASMAAGGAAFF